MNILLLLTDQQRWDAVGYRRGWLKTPNIDQLEKQSFSTTAFAQSPQCQPSRASMMTGRYPSSLRLWWNEMKLLPRERTVANILRDNRYTTAYFGKWHIHKNRNQLENFGWSPELSYLTEDWRDGKNLPEEAVQPKSKFVGLMRRKHWAGKLGNRKWYHEDVMTDRAIRFIRSAKKPFFATVSFYGPHPPYASPPPYCDMYPIADFDGNPGIVNYSGEQLSVDDWRLIKSQYYGCISWIDDCIGKILDYVKKRAPDTLVIFTSDHGDVLGEHGYFSKGMFAYDDVVRVPLLISGPGVGIRKYEHLVQMIDIVPTILDFVGIQRPAIMQGLSLRPAISSGDTVQNSVLSIIGREPRVRMVRTEQFKYWYCSQDDQEFLFNLDIDPGEKRNVATTNSKLLSRMRFELIKALVRSEDRGSY